MTVTCN